MSIIDKDTIEEKLGYIAATLEHFSKSIDKIESALENSINEKTCNQHKQDLITRINTTKENLNNKYNDVLKSFNDIENKVIAFNERLKNLEKIVDSLPRKNNKSKPTNKELTLSKINNIFQFILWIIIHPNSRNLLLILLILLIIYVGITDSHIIHDVFKAILKNLI